MIKNIISLYSNCVQYVNVSPVVSCVGRSRMLPGFCCYKWLSFVLCVFHLPPLLLLATVVSSCWLNFYNYYLSNAPKSLCKHNITAKAKISFSYPPTLCLILDIRLCVSANLFTEVYMLCYEYVPIKTHDFILWAFFLNIDCIPSLSVLVWFFFRKIGWNKVDFLKEKNIKLLTGSLGPKSRQHVGDKTGNQRLCCWVLRRKIFYSVFPSVIA